MIGLRWMACLAFGVETPSSTNPPTEEVVVTRTGAAEVQVTRDGAPVPPAEVHVEVEPRDSLPHQVEIVPTDLTTETKAASPGEVTDDDASKSLPSLRSPATKEASLVAAKLAPRLLRLQLREFSQLRAAARQAGGDLEISIRPIRITGEDLMVPLASSGYFEVDADSDPSVVVIRSRSTDPYLEKLRQEIALLEKRRRALLGDINLLEGLQREKP
jgi:hypothetical protein